MQKGVKDVMEQELSGRQIKQWLLSSHVELATLEEEEIRSLRSYVSYTQNLQKRHDEEYQRYEDDVRN